jgi:hypothetical protein
MAKSEWPAEVKALASAVAALRGAADEAENPYTSDILDGLNELSDMPLEAVKEAQERSWRLRQRADAVELELCEAVQRHLGITALQTKGAGHNLGALEGGGSGCVICQARAGSSEWRGTCPGKAAGDA